MINKFDRRKRTLCGALISGSTIALLFAGCGGGGTEKTPDTSVPQGKLDTASATGGTIAATGGVLATGGSAKMDAAIATGGSIAIDAASPDTGIVISPDASKPDTHVPDSDTPDKPQSTDLPIEAVPTDAAITVDTGPKTDAGGSPCPKPILAQQLGTGVIKFSKSISWGNNGNLLLGSTQFLAGDFLSLPVSYKGSADFFVANLQPSSTVKTYGASWVFSAGDEGDQFVSQVATSSDNMVGVMGVFLGTMDFGDQQISNPAEKERSYIAGLKIADGTGAWAKSIDLNGGQLHSIAGNPKQNFFLICGSAMNAAPSLVTAGAYKGGTDIVVAAIKASDGTIIWSKLFGGTGIDTCGAAALDDAGNAYFSGTFSSALDFGTGPLPFTPPAAADAGTNYINNSLWVAKIGLTGETLSAASFGITPGLNILQPDTESNRLFLSTDSQGNVVVSGTFRKGNLAFGNTILTPVGEDTFIAKLNSNLLPTWARRWGMARPGQVKPNGIATTSNGDVIAIGSFRGTIDFGQREYNLTSFANDASSTDISIVRLIGASGETACALQYGSPPPPSGTNGREATSISINRWASGELLDQIAVSGYLISTTLDFGSGTTPIAAEAYKSGSQTTNPQRPFLLKMQP